MSDFPLCRAAGLGCEKYNGGMSVKAPNYFLPASEVEKYLKMREHREIQERALKPQAVLPWEFTASDFDSYHCAPTLANSTGVMARIANVKLRAWLEAAPIVKAVNQDANWFHQDSDYIAKYQARVVCIEPLVSDTTDRFMKDWLACCDAYAAQVREGPFQKFADRARKLLDGGGK